MKSASAELISHLAQNSTTLATCWKVKRRDGTILGFTDHDEDIAFDLGDGDGSVTYKAATGYTRSAIANKIDLSADNLEVEGFLDSAAITEADLRAGKYDFAEVRIFLVNWADLGQGKIDLRRGAIGEITTRDELYVAELMGLSQRLSQVVGRTYTPECAVDLGSPECGIELKPNVWQATTAYSVGDLVSPTAFNARKFIVTTAGTSGASEPAWDTTIGNSTGDATVVWKTQEAWTFEDTVFANVSSDNSGFYGTAINDFGGNAVANGWFDEGLVTWTGGLNAGTSMEVKTYVNDLGIGSGAYVADGVDPDVTFVADNGAGEPAIVRDAGSFVADGFQFSMIITVSGADNAANNGDYVIVAVTATTLTINKDHAGEIVDDGPGNTSMAITGTGAAVARFELFLPMPFTIQRGDTFEVYPGCDKKLATCKAKFDNVVNFQGFPHVPGHDAVLAIPDAPN